MMRHFFSYIKNFHTAFSQVWVNVAAISLVGLIFQEKGIEPRKAITTMLISTLGIAFHLGMKELIKIRKEERKDVE